ncbi:hypothetical protein [Iodobacter fluviatilis]|uniref:Uncharacterized protein n=1 Tax=Iodobacter fluviatilis TaxID=537 RepID=A0A377Q5U5_9NEIS|nr:hypothetical protein [Iodobacter fluviatilis]TCU81117.1 hypothetical protein EV682_1289 [Iodobacter fluviatilis]STQ90125.1 Uncharacterised protein [Iodobacter fluviatilis]
MPLWHKGRKLLMLSERKTQIQQRLLSLQRQALASQEAQLLVIEASLQNVQTTLSAQYLNAIAVSKAQLFEQRRQQAVLLCEIQKLRLEHLQCKQQCELLKEQLGTIQIRLRELDHKALKFERWTKGEKQRWNLQALSSEEAEGQETMPWSGRLY